MFRQMPPSVIAFVVSIILFAGLGTALVLQSRRSSDQSELPPLRVLAAEALRKPLAAAAQSFRELTGQVVRLDFGASQSILTRLQIAGAADVFIPADDSYIELAKQKKLVEGYLPLATMHAVVVRRPDLGESIGSMAEFAKPGRKIGLANPEVAAVGKLVRAALLKRDLWAKIEACKPTYLGTVNEVASAARIGSIDVGICWDVTAAMHPDLPVEPIKEVSEITAKIQAAVTLGAKQPAQSWRFIRYLRGRGSQHFRDAGFKDVVTEPESTDQDLVIHAGSMLRPAIEQTLGEFEKSEGIKVTRVYNGCGILVSQMRTGRLPDLYFACDEKFLADVQDLFDPAETLTANQLVIATAKGNPHGVHTLADLAKPKLRVGIGHEQQCALGALTKETFLRTGVYGAVQKNVVVQSPTGDFLVNQLRTGSLDVVVAYKSNVTPFAGEIEADEISGIPCAAPIQPLAICKTTANRPACDRLVHRLKSEVSRKRFEELGFRWGALAK